MNVSADHKIFRAAALPGLAHALAVLFLLPALVSCLDTEPDSLTSISQPSSRPPPAELKVVTAEPGCRKEFPVEFRGISCAAHDYDPPAIPFGELYPPR